MWSSCFCSLCHFYMQLLWMLAAAVPSQESASLVHHEHEACAAGGLSNRPSRISPDDPSPISGIQGKDLPFRESYPPIRDPYLPFPQSGQGRYQPAHISPDYPYGDRGHPERLLTRPHMPSLLSSDHPLNKFKKAKRTVYALSAHVGYSPAPKKTDGGFGLPSIMVSTKDHVVPVSTHAKKAKAHKGKHDRRKHSSRHHKHAKAHRDQSSIKKHKGPEVDSDLLTLRGCALAALSSSTAAGRTQLQQQGQQQQQQQQAQSPVVSAAEDQPPTLANGQPPAQQQDNWQTAFAKGPDQASPCAGAAPDSPETCQKTLGLLASEHPAQAGAHAFPSSLQAPSPQAQPQLITSTKGYAETSSTPTNAANSDRHVMTTARLAAKSGLSTTDSPDAGTTLDHDMPDLGVQCLTKPWPAIKQVSDALNCGTSAVHR